MRPACPWLGDFCSIFKPTRSLFRPASGTLAHCPRYSELPKSCGGESLRARECVVCKVSCNRDVSRSARPVRSMAKDHWLIVQPSTEIITWLNHSALGSEAEPRQFSRPTPFSRDSGLWSLEELRVLTLEFRASIVTFRASMKVYRVHVIVSIVVSFFHGSQNTHRVHPD